MVARGYNIFFAIGTTTTINNLVSVYPLEKKKKVVSWVIHEVFSKGFGKPITNIVWLMHWCWLLTLLVVRFHNFMGLKPNWTLSLNQLNTLQMHQNKKCAKSTICLLYKASSARVEKPVSCQHNACNICVEAAVLFKRSVTPPLLI